MRKIIMILALVVLSGCALQPDQQYHTGQCVGKMTTEEAYGHLDPNRYTIQVLALSEERDIRGYLREIPGQDPIWVNWKHSLGKSWYAVIYGDFATKQEAKQRIQTLSPRILAQGPFVRSFAEVQSDKQTDVFRMR
ncbi:SPOR domain-containing protein [Photobacterium sp. WH77]|uniref:SPOR domain-containing protein n=2 Tax=Photobacterium TaxID=657 RepID=A0ABR9BHL6_9GAMM|nr:MULTISPECIES: SPOR domain-containing protein [Photobacterium]MBD8511205.1 SPOR domain-containing protein [Photobacterium arenosum]MBV7263154.1 SPOR domain-containing protein [Photobacterium sp. WH24]MCG2837932.1 SPOR domain-containing protein [Photobacterium sp. WH77]MCG2845550.1 SPOR domain-containing protein [Photobacterium sp. WH80]MDO6581868.1 SPOR domain-containing protein [Photobacterium sp. 2_MG-2023]